MTFGDLHQQIDYQAIHLSHPYYLKILNSLKPQRPYFFSKLDTSTLAVRFHQGDTETDNTDETNFFHLQAMLHSYEMMDRDELLSRARTIISSYPKDDQLYLVIAIILIKAKCYADAMTYLQLCTYYNENQLDAWSLQGLLASLAHDYGKAIYASKKALSKGFNLNNTLQKAFVFSLFLIGSPSRVDVLGSEALFAMNSALSTTLNADNIVIFHRTLDAQETIKNKPILLCVCDSKYFNAYSKNLLLSLRGTESLHTLHIHLINPTQRDLMWLDEYDSDNLIISYENCGEPLGINSAYLASIRFIRAAYFIDNFKANYLIVDADSILNSPNALGAFYNSAEKTTLYRVDNNPIWDKISAPFVYIPYTKSGQEFINRCANFLYDSFHGPNKNLGFWYIDQLALQGSYMAAHEEADLVSSKVLSDIDCGPTSIFWTLSTDKRKTEYTLRCEELNTTPLQEK